MVINNLKELLEKCFKDSFPLLQFPDEMLEFKLALIIDKHINTDENIKLIDYFYLNKSIDRLAKIRLSYWSCISPYRGKKLTEVQKFLLKSAVDTLILFVSNLFLHGFSLILHSLLATIRDEIVNESPIKHILTFFSKYLLTEDIKVPENYIEFCDQLSEWIEQNPDEVIETL